MPAPSYKTDLAIITIIPEEYNAVRAHLTELQHVPGDHDAPNQYAWRTGWVSAMHEARYRVVLALTGKPTGNRAALATIATIQRFWPRYVLLVGIAGGLSRDGLTKGDVVVSSKIWAYEYGKQERAFQPRPDFTYSVDGSLLTAAQTLSDEWKGRILAEPPEAGHVPKLRCGPVASGDKVVDDVSNDFFDAVVAAWPKITAVEMEGAGVAEAIEDMHERGASVGFIMIRGISDMPSAGHVDPAPGIKTAERDAWKNYASASAASFAIHMIASAWPVPSRGDDAIDRP